VDGLVVGYIVDGLVVGDVGHNGVFPTKRVVTSDIKHSG